MYRVTCAVLALVGLSVRVSGGYGPADACCLPPCGCEAVAVDCCDPCAIVEPPAQSQPPAAPLPAPPENPAPQGPTQSPAEPPSTPVEATRPAETSGARAATPIAEPPASALPQPAPPAARAERPLAEAPVAPAASPAAPAPQAQPLSDSRYASPAPVEAPPASAERANYQDIFSEGADNAPAAAEPATDDARPAVESTPEPEPQAVAQPPQRDAPAAEPASAETPSAELPAADATSAGPAPESEPPTEPSSAPAAEAPATEAPAAEPPPAERTPPESIDLFGPTSAVETLTAPGGYASTEFRSWTTAIGVRLGECRIAAMDAEFVVLKDASGGSQSVRYADLSDADLRFSRDQAAARRGQLAAQAERSKQFAAD